MADAVTAHWESLGRPVRFLQTGLVRPRTPEIVLLPGLGALGYLLPMVRACGSWTRVRLLDLPGFGHPVTARCPATLADMVATAARWLDHVAEDPVLLVGHSTGAQAALHVALSVPHRVAAVCLMGPTFPPEARTWRPLLQGVLRTVMHEPPGQVPATFRDYLRGRSGVLTLLRSSMVDRPEDLIGRVDRPTYVARGEHDALCPAPWAARLAATAGRARAVSLPGAHNFVFNHPDAASQWLRNCSRAVAGCGTS